MDNWLDTIHSMGYHGNKKQHDSLLHTVNVTLGKQSFLGGSTWTAADLLMWSYINVFKLKECLPSNVQKWFKSMNNASGFKNAAGIVAAMET